MPRGIWTIKRVHLSITFVVIVTSISFSPSHLLVARNGVLRCPRPWATLHTPTGNVAHGREQRCPRPRTTNRNGFRIGGPAPCIIASYAQGLLGRTSPSTHTLQHLFKAMKFNAKRKSTCEMLNNEYKSCHLGCSMPIFATQKPLWCHC